MTAAAAVKKQKDIVKKRSYVALVSILLLVVFLGPFICVISRFPSRRSRPLNLGHLP